MLDTNRILSSLLCKDLNQEKGETILLIWYQLLVGLRSHPQVGFDFFVALGEFLLEDSGIL